MSLTSELEELITFLAPLVAKEYETPGKVVAATSKQWQDLAKNLDDARQALADAARALDVAAATAKGNTSDKTDRSLRFATGAESARDREQWVEDLRDRARVYAKRVPADPAPVPLTAKETAELNTAIAKATAAEAVAMTEKASLKAAETRLKAEAASLRANELNESKAQLEELRTALDLAEKQLSQAGEGDGTADLERRITDLHRGIDREVEAIALRVPRVKAEKTGWEAAKSSLMAAQSGVESARQKLGELKSQDPQSRSFTQDLDLESEMILVLRRRLEGVARRG